MTSRAALVSASDRRSAGGHRADLVVLGVEAALLAAAAVVGVVLNRRGVGLHAEAAPLFATWRPHVGWGTPAAVLVAAAVIGWGVPWARTARWGRLLAAAYLAAVTWTMSLALVDGWSAGFTRRLTPQAEYLNEVPRVSDIPATLAGFSDRILDFQPDAWSTHTAGHPPGTLLVFVWLDRIGLGGGTAAAFACVLVGATVTVSVPATLRALGAVDAARVVVPFLVLLPGAVWVGASADGVFTGVVAAGLALLAVRGRSAPAAGGLLLGFALYLSYGFVLVGLLALAVLALRPADRLGASLGALAGVAAVVVAFTVAGFWWLDGYHLVVRRYQQGWAADRPYGYWVWANLAALLLSAGPVLGPALRRTAVAGRVARAARPTVLLPLAAAAAVAAADLSGLSKAEVERIWLPFVVWLLVAVAHLPAESRRWWLAVQAVTALAVNHLLWTVS
jgi:methylthioxylose transferase